jgi:hypothetical protein
MTVSTTHSNNEVNDWSSTGLVNSCGYRVASASAARPLDYVAARLTTAVVEAACGEKFQLGAHAHYRFGLEPFRTVDVTAWPLKVARGVVTARSRKPPGAQCPQRKRRSL